MKIERECYWPNCLERALPNRQGRTSGYCHRHLRMQNMLTRLKVSHKEVEALWRIGRYTDKNGYVMRLHGGTWKAEHRVILEMHLKRPLRAGESVHHKNGIRSDNRVENLELWVGNIRYGQRATDIRCPNCGTSYWEIAS